MLDTYASKYHDLKAPRKLKWKPALGSVSLTIKVGGDSLDLNVTPLHATIIMHFQVNSFCSLFLLLHTLTASCLRCQVCCKCECVHTLTSFVWPSQSLLQDTEREEKKDDAFQPSHQQLRVSSDILAIALLLTLRARQHMHTIVCKLEAQHLFKQHDISSQLNT